MSYRKLVAAALVAAAITACSAQNTGPSTAPAAAAGGTLRFGVGFTLDDWEPFNKPNNTYVSAVFEQLVEQAPDGIELLPRLATSWKATGGQVEFTLRTGVVFHDGTPFDARAVKVNLERIRDSMTEFATIMKPVEEILTPDASHVVLKLKRPAPALPAQLARTGGYMLSPKTIKDGTFKTQPAGTGPWKYNAAQSIRDSKVVLDFFDKYYEPDKVGPRRLEIHTIADDDSGYNALVTGQVDVVSVAAQYKKRAETQGLKSLWYPGLRYHFLFFDRKDTFADPRVRQAVCHSLDTKALLDGQFEGLGESYPQRFSEGQPGYNPQVRGYTRDVTKARALLAESGKKDVSFTFPVFPGTELLGELVRSQLAESGITVKVEKMSIPQYFSTFDRYPAAYNTSNSESTGPLDYYSYRFAPDGGGNPYKTGSPELEKLAEQALAGGTDAEREDLYRRMTQIIHDQALDCGFFSRPITFIWDPRKVDNIVPTRFEPSVFRYKEARIHA
ncbi:ABC transporter substrate-binding protein [Nonomuraea sp. NPDC059023]|uniref:ABC transporter substrate-binding protein n=1 Tax=unclassified Nonomuraea TaxID=2593643 RepID=UPI00368C2317